MSNSNGLHHASFTPNPEDSGAQGSSHGFGLESERSLIGIPPAEPDEHDRGLFFFFDSWTGQPSQTSASEESEYAVPEDSITASPSNDSTSLLQAMTPQSNFDVPRTENSQTRPYGSKTSSSGFNVPNTPSASGPASLEAHNARSSPVLLQTQSGSWTTEGRTPPTLSPSPDRTSSDPVDPLEGINDPRDTIIINQYDIEFLKDLEAQERLDQPNNSNDSMVPLHDRRQVTRHGSPNARDIPKKANLKKNELHISTSQSTNLVIRQKNDRRTQVGKKERRQLTEEEKKRARILRDIGVCLRCLFNHETVSVGRWAKMMFGPY